MPRRMPLHRNASTQVMSNQCHEICQPESPNVTFTAESRAQILNSLTIPAHESEPPKVVCTIGLGVNKYAQVLRSHEDWANNRGSPTSRNHL